MLLVTFSFELFELLFFKCGYNCCLTEKLLLFADFVQDATSGIKVPRRRLLVQFTCDLCGERTKRLVNQLAYERGLVFVQVFNCAFGYFACTNGIGDQFLPYSLFFFFKYLERGDSNHGSLAWETEFAKAVHLRWNWWTVS